MLRRTDLDPSRSADPARDLLGPDAYEPAAARPRPRPPRAIDGEERVTVAASPFTMGAPGPGTLAGVRVGYDA